MKQNLSIIFIFAFSLSAQTRIDLRTQGKNADFSAYPFTKPAKFGTTPPATCDPGEVFFDSDTTAGANLTLCTSTNVWTSVNVAPPIAPYFAAFVASGGSVTITNATHGQGTDCLWTPPEVYTRAGSINTFFVGSGYTCDQSNGTVVLTFGDATQSGYVKFGRHGGSGGGSGGGGGSGDVISDVGVAVDGQMTVANGTTGKHVDFFQGNGLYKFVNGIPTLITGSATDCVYQNATASPCPAVNFSQVEPRSLRVLDSAVTITNLGAGACIAEREVTIPGASQNDFAKVGPPVHFDHRLSLHPRVSDVDKVKWSVCNPTAATISVTVGNYMIGVDPQ